MVIIICLRQVALSDAWLTIGTRHIISIIYTEYAGGNPQLSEGWPDTESASSQGRCITRILSTPRTAPGWAATRPPVSACDRGAYDSADNGTARILVQCLRGRRTIVYCFNQYIIFGSLCHSLYDRIVRIRQRTICCGMNNFSVLRSLFADADCGAS